MKTIAFAMFFLLSPDVSCQTPAKDADTLQSLLVEVRQLRQAIEGMTVASQRVQIALYALQLQDNAVARSAKRVDDAREVFRKRGESKSYGYGRPKSAERARQWHDAPGRGQIKGTELPLAKARLEEATTDLQTCQAAEAEASSQLRNEQSKLTELQDRIERLDKTLDHQNNNGH